MKLTYKLNSLSENSHLSFDFSSEGIYPTNINVLVGKNGTGKSQAIRQLIEAFRTKDSSKLKDANFDKLIFISFSPFETDKPETTENYTYIGLKDLKRRVSFSALDNKAIVSLKKLLSSKEGLRNLQNFFDIFQEAVLFDSIKIRIPNKNTITNDTFVVTKNKKIFVKLTLEDIKNLASNEDYSLSKFTHSTRAQPPVYLSYKGNDIAFSSGQRTFFSTILGILANIKQNSLLLIDEPEVFLHPNIEVSLLRMIKQLLKKYNSKCIIATHSPIVVREVPSNCVLILSVNNGVTDIRQPSFETFGANLEQIANEIYEDLFIEKPYQEHLKTLIKEGDTYNSLLEKYRDKLSSDNLMTLVNLLENETSD